MHVRPPRAYGVGFAKLLARADDEAKIGFKVHPHMLRQAAARRSPIKASGPEFGRFGSNAPQPR